MRERVFYKHEVDGLIPSAGTNLEREPKKFRRGLLNPLGLLRVCEAGSPRSASLRREIPDGDGRRLESGWTAEKSLRFDSSSLRHLIKSFTIDIWKRHRKVEGQ